MGDIIGDIPNDVFMYGSRQYWKPIVDAINKGASVKEVDNLFYKYERWAKTQKAAILRHNTRTQIEVTDIIDRWNTRDKPHKALLKYYTTNNEVNTTFKSINSELKSEKWFANGDLDISATTSVRVNGYTYMDGRISLTKERLQHVKSALGKIGQRKSATISKDEADAMATFWHEITHNRNIHGSMKITDAQRGIMEMMNEFVARKTLPEFYTKLGCSKIPYPQFIEDRQSTGYNARVIGYDYVIKKLGLNAEKVLSSAKKNLFQLKYTEQETTAIQALLDGGLDKFKCINGKIISRQQIKKIVNICKNGVSLSTIDNYLKLEGIIL